MIKITPFLWFDNNLDEALELYASVFPNFKVTAKVPYGEAGPGPKGTLMTASFVIEGQEFSAINGGPMFKFTEAISIVVHCDTQEEVDHYWNSLCAGGQPSRCGWLKDKFGLSWQIVPRQLIQLLQDKDRGKANRVMQAMMKMDKIHIPTLLEAAGDEVIAEA